MHTIVKIASQKIPSTDPGTTWNALYPACLACEFGKKKIIPKEYLKQTTETFIIN